MRVCKKSDSAITIPDYTTIENALCERRKANYIILVSIIGERLIKTMVL